jgi:hypothetical protein
MEIQATSYKKNIFLHRETFMIIGTVLGILLAATFIFFFLWSHFRIGFVWLVSFILIFAMRRSDSWKMGLEGFYLLTFLYSYIFGLWFALPIVYMAFALVVKFRPDELNGVITHSIAITFVAIAARFFLGSHGLALGSAEFTFIALASIFPGIAADFFLAWKMAPVPLFKNFINHAMDFTVNYFVITSIGFTLFKFFMTLA